MRKHPCHSGITYVSHETEVELNKVHTDIVDRINYWNQRWQWIQCTKSEHCNHLHVIMLLNYSTL